MSIGAKSDVLDSLYSILKEYANQVDYRCGLFTQFEVRDRPVVPMTIFRPVQASLDELILFEKIERMFYQMPISANLGKSWVALDLKYDSIAPASRPYDYER